MPHLLRSRWTPALALLGTLAMPGSAHAGFEVTYLFTNSDGEPLANARLTPNELTSYVNQASCQCGETFGARIFLNNNDGTSYPANTRVRTYVGTSCDQGQNAISNFGPCVQVYDGPANEYDDGGILIPYEQVWLSSPAAGVNIPISSADPQAPCPDSQTGAGKIWICVDANSDSNCLSDEFVTVTTINQSADTGDGTTDPTGGGQGGASDSITYDYLAPQNSLSGFRSNAGDGKVQIAWDRAEVNDITGYRVLCADQNGDPPKRDEFVNSSTPPTGQARTNGTLYYTAANLCGEDVVYGSTPTDPGTTDGGTTDGGTTSGDVGSTTDDGSMTTTGRGFFATTGDGSTGGTGGDSTTGTGATTGGGSSDGVACDSTASPLCDLGWEYVCSDHIAASSVTAEVTGLRNEEPYEFLVIAYDRSGNPKIMSSVFTATPVETTDFWERCEEQGDLCGNGGFCHCQSGDAEQPPVWLGVGLLLLGLARRRRIRR